MISAIESVKVCVVVVTYNGEQWLDRCFGSLRNSRYPVKTILVDNKSTDATVARVRKDYPEVEIIANVQNAGFGKANNQGITRAISEENSFVFLLNQDAWIENDTIGNLVMALKQYPEFGVISPLHFTGSGDKLDYNFESYLLKDYSAETISKWIHGDYSAVQASQFINAAAWMVRREALELVGGFGPLFFHYGEDYDFIHRLNFFGLKLGFITSARIFHDREHRKKENFPNDVLSLRKYFYTGSLVRMTELRHSFFISFLGVFFWNWKELAVLFFKGKWKSPIVFLHVIFNILKNMTTISSYRKQIASTDKFRFLRQAGA